MTLDPTKRFTNRVADYIKGRPGYPSSIIEELRKLAPLTQETVVADIGSGTGLSAELFLHSGCRVIGVEPNSAMRAEAEQRFKGVRQFISVSGSADATTLHDGSVDWIVCAQAFHWFDPVRTRLEFQRILKPDGHVVLMWNERQKDGDAFATAYEQIIQDYATDYVRVRHENVNESQIASFFGQEPIRLVFPHDHRLDWQSLLARLKSSSYMPSESPAADTMSESLRNVFNRCRRDGFVSMRYLCRIFVGRFWL